jgi:23S rRNA (uracil1939-C5)-methyltransferase
MKQSEVQNISIERISHEGRGIGQLEDGKTVFLDNALPSEVVDATLTLNKPSYSEGIAFNINKVSETRQVPKCQHFGICGGCSLQHMQQDLQLKIKQDSLIEQIEKFGKTTPREIIDPIEGPLWNYRHKGRLSCKYVEKKGKVLLGFREKKGRYVADLLSCQILQKWFAENLVNLASLIESLSVKKYVPQIEIACGTNTKAIVIRHLKPLSDVDLDLLEKFSNDNDLHIYSQIKGPKTIIKLFPNDNNEFMEYELEEYGLKYKFHPCDFTQINPSINRKMVSRAIEWLDLNDNDVVLDLYCGIGNFSLPIAQRAKEVIGVEGEEVMVQRARNNAKYNGIKNTEFLAADLNNNLPIEAILKKPNKMLLDPSRAGAADIAENLSINPEVIVYVSCNISTLARDIDFLCNKHNYSLEKTGIIDMFPHTQHAEAIALLRKKV